MVIEGENGKYHILPLFFITSSFSSAQDQSEERDREIKREISCARIEKERIYSKSRNDVSNGELPKMGVDAS